MNHGILVAGGLALVVTFLQPLAAASQVQFAFRPDRILIIPKPGHELPLARLHAVERVTIRRAYPRLGNIHVLQIPAGASAPDIVRRYQQSGHCTSAELDHAVQGAAVPNDPSFVQQWALNNTGQVANAVSDVDIDAPEAWDVRSDATNTIVAILDSGVRISHEDLNANLWRNPGETPNNGIDDDNNGYVDDVYGIDALNNTGNPVDENGHGSVIAGIIGAAGNNGRGVTGVAWRARLMICKFLNSAGGGNISDTVECIDYARANGARILNASFVTTEVSEALSNAVSACEQAGLIFVAASGNSRTNIDLAPFFPASYPNSNIVVVMATDAADRLYDRNNVGLTNVDLAAPGVSIYSTWFIVDNSYFTFSGTSMAAGFVAGAMALVWEEHPAEPYWKIIQRVLAATDPLPILADKCVTGGRLNLGDAMNPIPVLSSFRASGSAEMDIQLRKGAPEQRYALLCSPDLREWTSVQTNTASGLGRTSFSVTIDSTTGQQFFRALAVP